MPIRYLDEKHLEVNGVRFEFGFAVDLEPSTPLMPFVWKQRVQLDNYEELLTGRSNRNVVELGIHLGGSAILLDRLLEPRRLVAVDLAREPAPALAHYVETHGRAEVVRASYGVDQADGPRLSAIFDEAFGEEPIDLVIDDASHAYTPTLASFEAIFPRLRPGALYIVEDWDWCHQLAAGVAAALEDPSHPAHAALLARFGSAPAPEQRTLELGRFAMEATLLAAGTRELVREVRVRHSWIVIERGAGPLPPGPFRLANVALDRFDVLRSREGLADAVFE
jgi:predicted O-methyltransferase YrrM